MTLNDYYHKPPRFLILRRLSYLRNREDRYFKFGMLDNLSKSQPRSDKLPLKEAWS